jgi:hypothetical protein
LFVSPLTPVAAAAAAAATESKHNNKNVRGTRYVRIKWLSTDDGLSHVTGLVLLPCVARWNNIIAIHVRYTHSWKCTSTAIIIKYITLYKYTWECIWLTTVASSQSLLVGAYAAALKRTEVFREKN